MIDDVKRLIIVVGCQRSGTTMTGQILGAHENAVLIDEFEGLYPWFHALAAGTPNLKVLMADVLAKSITKYAKPVERFIQEDGRVRLAGNIDTLVLKAPNLTYSFEAISKLEISAHIIYPIRDPRAVVASMQRLSHINFVENQMRLIRKTPDIESMFESEFRILDDADCPHHIRAAIIWRIKSGLTSKFEKRGLPVLQFLYEDLVRSPDLWISKMLEFCGFSPSDKPRHHETIYQGIGPGETKRRRAIDTGGVTGWTASLSKTVAAEIVETAQPLSGAFGYA